MTHARAFAAFWWDFIVGDDWRTAAGIAVALALTALLAHHGVSAWWLMPLALIAAPRHTPTRLSNGNPARGLPFRTDWAIYSRSAEERSLTGTVRGSAG
jgi:hypothetical protein